eukprot:5574864-Amphidinium_carterae.1
MAALVASLFRVSADGLHSYDPACITRGLVAIASNAPTKCTIAPPRTMATQQWSIVGFMDAKVKGMQPGPSSMLEILVAGAPIFIAKAARP